MRLFRFPNPIIVMLTVPSRWKWSHLFIESPRLCIINVHSDKKHQSKCQAMIIIVVSELLYALSWMDRSEEFSARFFISCNIQIQLSRCSTSNAIILYALDNRNCNVYNSLFWHWFPSLPGTTVSNPVSSNFWIMDFNALTDSRPSGEFYSHKE